MAAWKSASREDQTAFSLIVGGTFLIAYWGLRVPAAFGIGWFPHFSF